MSIITCFKMAIVGKKLNKTKIFLKNNKNCSYFSKLMSIIPCFSLLRVMSGTSRSFIGSWKRKIITCWQLEIKYISLLTRPMLRLLSSKAQEHKDFWKPSKPCHVGIHWNALAVSALRWVPIYQGFRHFFRFFASFCIRRISHQQN